MFRRSVGRIWKGVRSLVTATQKHPAEDIRTHGAKAPAVFAAELGAVRSVRVIDDGKRIHIKQGSLIATYMDASWLWINDPVHWDAATGQRLTAARFIPDPVQLRISDAVFSDDKLVTLRWDYGNWKSTGPMPAETVFSADWLAGHAYERSETVTSEENGRDTLPSPLREGPSSAPLCASLPSMEWEEIRSGDDGTLRLCRGVAEAGGVIVSGCPTTEGAVAVVAERIAPVQPSIYGRLFDVVAQAEDEVINVAYSTQELEPHTDLSYYESPPGLQLLLCRRFDSGVRGGDSTLVDAVGAAELLRQVDPWAFLVLSSVPATFQKVHYRRARPVHMVYHRPHIVTSLSASAALAVATDHATVMKDAVQGLESDRIAIDAKYTQAFELAQGLGPVTGTFWAPPFEGPLHCSGSWVPAYTAAYRRFEAILNGGAPERLAEAQASTSSQVALPHVPWLEFRLEPGECLVFNNRRMLHGRRAFNLRDADPPTPTEAHTHASGPHATPYRRHLEGAYLNIDEFASKLRHLEVVASTGSQVPDTRWHVANQSNEGWRSSPPSFL